MSFRSERNGGHPDGDQGLPEGAPREWTDWYRFARDELGYGHEERVEYANLRYVEEQNRRSLREQQSQSHAPGEAD